MESKILTAINNNDLDEMLVCCNKGYTAKIVEILCEMGLTKLRKRMMETKEYVRYVFETNNIKLIDEIYDTCANHFEPFIYANVMQFICVNPYHFWKFVDIVPIHKYQIEKYNMDEIYLNILHNETVFGKINKTRFKMIRKLYEMGVCVPKNRVLNIHVKDINFKYNKLYFDIFVDHPYVLYWMMHQFAFGLPNLSAENRLLLEQYCSCYDNLLQSTYLWQHIRQLYVKSDTKWVPYKHKYYQKKVQANIMLAKMIYEKIDLSKV